MSVYGSILKELLIAERNVTEVCAAVTCDSRKAAPGTAFAAIPGSVVDGHDFIPAALEKGAGLIIMERELPLPPGVPVLLVQDAAAAFALLVRHLAGKPDEALSLWGVTGTNGKTTSAFLLEHIFNGAQLPCGLVSTVEYRTGSKIIPGERTTPDPETLFSLFKAMKQNHLVCAAMELSSHSLVQNRAAGIQLEGGIFTNLTGDHLDYHGDMEHYYQAKKRLFTHYLAPEGRAIINADDPWGERLCRELEGKVKLLSFSAEGKGNCRIGKCRLESSGAAFELVHPEYGILDISSNLAGAYNIRNLTGAVLGALEKGVAPDKIETILKFPVRVPGRLESFPLPGGGTAYVDYAHTDDALINVLQAVRPITKGKVKVLFGAGGDRDRTKRPRMGKAAAVHADFLYVTSDNPRSENPDEIIADILKGIPENSLYEVIPDRKKAIAAALRDCEKNDALVIAGKGHENYQEIKGVKYPFSDIEEIKAFIRGEA
jgi:UDP-N-acetylmuramoyl-L-alanyl-D-glutamate--2,6-diaminopimelate ligase